MQDLQKRNIKTPQSVVTQNLPSMASSSSNVATGARRRLTFTTSEQHCPVKKSNNGQSLYDLSSKQKLIFFFFGLH